MPRRMWRAEVGLLQAEISLWITAGLCLLCFGSYMAERTSAMFLAKRFYPATVHAAGSQSERAAGSQQRATPDGILGRLEIPAIQLSVPMVTGVEPMSLIRGVGHIPGTALPGGLGTVGLAGHRDTYLRALRRVEIGMQVSLIDVTGTYHYTVERTEIVTPDEVRVLDIQTTPKLTLITCYPFDYVGPAPRRFVVHATLNSVTPDN